MWITIDAGCARILQKKSEENRTMFWRFLFACVSMILIFLVPLMWRRKRKGPAGPEGTQGSAGGGP